jgi:S-DNA-T family DNA segregation ATPase FtsK/SpoIIIE
MNTGRCASSTRRAALPVSEDVDLEAVAIGRREDGEPWRVKVLGTHILVAGMTGAGKGSVLWSLLRALGPEIRDCPVRHIKAERTRSA